ncbi:transmembrane protein 256 homolog [Musca domestica]|uniref:Transmembrane protein 256 homolog n=1 Tax=Musca domestica TaxID=7370 RepID=A0A1I8N8W9_MUSDO|nr:transmembrane protein 256 homolog [Musca domestica]
MSWGETLNYLTLGNPVSQAVINSASAVLKGSGLKPKQAIQDVVVAPPKLLNLWEIAGNNYHFVRLAGLSGATAVIMGAYGKHYLVKIIDAKEQMESKAVFETANRFHFLHSFALLAMPLARRPVLTGSLMAAGTILFSGPMYYRALTGDRTFIQVATCGGFCLIAAWLSLIF